MRPGAPMKRADAEFPEGVPAEISGAASGDYPVGEDPVIVVGRIQGGETSGTAARKADFVAAEPAPAI